MVYGDIAEAKLADYVKPDRFRTITEECLGVPKGISEVPVIIGLKKNSKIKASEGFPVCFDDCFRIFGYLRPDSDYKENTSSIGKDLTLVLNEFDKDKCLLIFRHPDGTEKPMYFVNLCDVSALLAECLNPNIVFRSATM